MWWRGVVRQKVGGACGVGVVRNNGVEHVVEGCG